MLLISHNELALAQLNLINQNILYKNKAVVMIISVSLFNYIL